MGKLEQGREAYAARAWVDAYTSLGEADRTAPLDAGDLELLATSAYMLGRLDDYVRAHERAHQLHLDAGELPRAARCAFWIATSHAAQGELGPATGWLGRAQRLLEREGHDCVEQGYLLVPVVHQHEAAGAWQAMVDVAADIARIGERHGDADLAAIGVHVRGRALVKQGDVEAGLALLDEVMLAATAGELSPVVTGLLYCSVIEACQEAYAPRRAKEWTTALTRWCAEQPDMVAFTGRCLVHRAEIMQLGGFWGDALEEARRASERHGMSHAGAAQALYRQGELHRLQGDVDAAEEAYRQASLRGYEPQPGLALLRLGQGKTDAAAAAIRRVLGETADGLKRASLLGACVEIMIAADDLGAAGAACRELQEVARTYASGLLAAMSAHSRGALDLATGDASGALVALRGAWHAWQEHDAPYEAAQARVLVGLACRALGDDDAAALELEAARTAFAHLGAAPDLARVDALTQPRGRDNPYGLTPRELEVLRLVAAGKTNRAIADQLFISEKTVARHMSNIFAKLRLSSRAAATAFAYENALV